MQLPRITKDSREGDSNYVAPTSFPIGPTFVKYKHNPILRPNPDNDFESSYIYNASAIVVDDTVFLFYRAQNAAKTSLVGLAWSTDGYNFVRYHKPVLYPTEPWEHGGGCEDPRITRDPVLKLFVMTYTAYDRTNARLCVATSENMFDWQKQPPIIHPDSSWTDIVIDSNGNRYKRQGWLKLGAVFTQRHPVTNKFYMIFGDCAFHLAESTDLQHWQLRSHEYAENLFAEGVHPWQDKLIEPGAAPIRLLEGPGKNRYVLFYNSATTGRHTNLPKDTYAISQMLIDYDNLFLGPQARLEKPILVPDQDNERHGQVNRVVFTEGIVQFKGQWFLYFGQGDSELGVATCAIE
jgi:predicted GH43/DUF377 family glycosyl hydrolase